MDRALDSSRHIYGVEISPWHAAVVHYHKRCHLSAEYLSDTDPICTTCLMLMGVYPTTRSNAQVALA